MNTKAGSWEKDPKTGKLKLVGRTRDDVAEGKSATAGEANKSKGGKS